MSEIHEVPNSNEVASEETNFLSLEEAIEKVTIIAKTDNDLSDGTAIFFTADGVKKILERITPPLAQAGFDINAKIDRIIEITMDTAYDKYGDCDFDNAANEDTVELSFDTYDNKISVDEVCVSNEEVLSELEDMTTNIIESAKSKVMEELFPAEPEPQAEAKVQAES